MVFQFAWLIYAITASVLFPFLRFYVDNPDTISYITVARKYLHADFSHAVNGYWSPLLSWVLGLLLNFRGDELITFKILQLLIGMFAMYNYIILVYAMVRTKFLRIIVSLACIPFLISYALLNLTPDLLILSMLLFYLRLVSEREFFNHRHFGLIAGVLGLLLYFSKSFGFIFFILHFTILLLRNVFQTKEYAFKKHLLNNYFQSVICFACISSIWIYLISDKYRHFTISESAYFNLSKEVAAGPGHENKLPILASGLYSPANNSAVNAWEDPGTALKLTPLHLFTRKDDMQIYGETVKRNLLSIYYFDFRRQTGFVLVLLMTAFLIFGKRKKFITDDHFFSTLLAVVLVYMIYSFVLVHARYTWINTLLMILFSCCFLEELLPVNKTQRSLGTALFVVALAGISLKRPFKELFFTADRNMTGREIMQALLHPFNTLNKTYQPDEQLHDARRELRTRIHEGESFASVIDSAGMRDGYTQASLIAFASGGKYYGQLSENDSLLRNRLAAFGIVHLISFQENTRMTDELGWRIIYNNPEVPLKVYSRRN